MRLLSGESRPPLQALNLKQSNYDLYYSLAKLWYTRHGIIHKGSGSLYDKNPANPTVRPLRELNHDDVIDFLQAVSEEIKYIVNNLLTAACPTNQYSSSSE